MKPTYAHPDEAKIFDRVVCRCGKKATLVRSENMKLIGWCREHEKESKNK